MSTFIILTTSIVFVSILLYFRQSIYILSIKMMYGEFHIRYMSLINSTTNYQSTYYVKGELSNQVSNIKSALNNKSKYKTELSLYFQNIEYGISSKDLIAKLGKPVSSDLIDMSEIKVVSMEYNIQENNIVDKYIYYFYNDKYYLGEFIFNKIQEQTSNQILENISKKYKKNLQNDDQYIIVDKKGNYLNYKDYGYRISVSYFNGESPDVVHLISSQRKQRELSRSHYEYQLDVQGLSF